MSVQKTIRITEAQEAFLQRKKRDLKKFSELQGMEELVSDSMVFQALLRYWMVQENEKPEEIKAHKMDGRMLWKKKKQKILEER